MNRSYYSLALIKEGDKLHFFRATKDFLFDWQFVKTVDFDGTEEMKAMGLSRAKLGVQTKVSCAFFNNDKLYVFITNDTNKDKTFSNTSSSLVMFDFQLASDKRSI